VEDAFDGPSLVLATATEGSTPSMSTNQSQAEMLDFSFVCDIIISQSNPETIMQIKLNDERKLVEYSTIEVGSLFLYNLTILGKDMANGRHPSVIEEKLTLLIKTDERGNCSEVGGNRSFGFSGGIGVYPVKCLIVEY
jgi:hypothetical protein